MITELEDEDEGAQQAHWPTLASKCSAKEEGRCRNGQAPHWRTVGRSLKGKQWQAD